MNKTLLFTFLLAIFSFNLSASPETQKAFNEAYQNYQDQLKLGFNQDLIPYAKSAYELGLTNFAENDLSVGALAHNYGLILNATHQYEQAIESFKNAIRIYELDGKNSINSLINSQIELGKVYRSRASGVRSGKSSYASSRKYFNKAISLAEEHNDEFGLAKIKLTVGIAIMSSGSMDENQAKKVKSYTEEAYDVFVKNKSNLKFEAAFWSGKINSLLGNSNKMISYFEEATNQPIENQLSQSFALSSHAFLVKAYSKKGEEELATKHCQAIGSVTPWTENTEASPVYILNPQYPKSAARRGKEGWVQFSFTIDEYGFVKDLKNIANEGSKVFITQAKKVIPKWRFVPRFVEGKAVSTENMVYTMQFKLAK